MSEIGPRSAGRAEASPLDWPRESRSAFDAQHWCHFRLVTNQVLMLTDSSRFGTGWHSLGYKDMKGIEREDRSAVPPAI